jgi:hypothetical protein
MSASRDDDEDDKLWLFWERGQNKSVRLWVGDKTENNKRRNDRHGGVILLLRAVPVDRKGCRGLIKK